MLGLPGHGQGLSPSSTARSAPPEAAQQRRHYILCRARNDLDAHAACLINIPVCKGRSPADHSHAVRPIKT